MSKLEKTPLKYYKKLLDLVESGVFYVSAQEHTLLTKNGKEVSRVVKLYDRNHEVAHAVSDGRTSHEALRELEKWAQENL